MLSQFHDGFFCVFISVCGCGTTENTITIIKSVLTAQRELWTEDICYITSDLTL